MEITNDKISVVMLNWNGLMYLKRTIPAVLNQDYKNFDLVIVDNGSTDGSIEYVNSFKEIKLIRNSENLGYSVGKNIGVQNASGKFIYLIDNDILLPNDKVLSNLYTNIRQLNKNSILSLVMLNDGDAATKYYAYCYGLLGPIYNKNLLVDKITPQTYLSGAPMGGNIFISKENWDTIGGFDGAQPYYLDDFDLGARASVLGFNSFVSSDCILIHLGKEEAIKKDKWLWKYKYFFSGYSIVIFKNYRLLNLLYRYPLFVSFSLIKTIKYCIKFCSIRPVLSLIKSIGFFVKILPDILLERKKIQAKRVVKKDIFLKIKPIVF